jgi:GTP cyclohydrolase II
MSITVKRPNMKEIVRKSGKTPEQVTAFIELVKRSMDPCQKQISVVEGGLSRSYSVERRGIGLLKTVYGNFWQFNFVIDDHWKKYSVIVKSEIDFETLNPIFKQQDRLVLRTDSGCETGQLFGDLTCECCEQLNLAMQTIAEVGEGMIVNIPRQDGRGMGLTFKLATLWIQDLLNVHTVESAGLLASSGVIDIRTYSGVICILKFFGLLPSQIINFATNNPDKLGVFGENGYMIAEDLVPITIKPTEHTAHHLEAKKEYLNHKGQRPH